MEPLTSNVERLEQALERELSYLTQTALSASPAGSPAWNEALAYYQLTPATSAQRQVWASREAQTSGACLEEVRAALEVLSQRLAWWIEQLVADDLPSTELSHLQQLRARQRRLVEEAVQAYQSAVLPQRARGLAGIFAAANRTSPADSSRVTGHIELTFKCRHCGAPQQAILGFTCAFCDQPLFE